MQSDPTCVIDRSDEPVVEVVTLIRGQAIDERSCAVASRKAPVSLPVRYRDGDLQRPSRDFSEAGLTERLVFFHVIAVAARPSCLVLPVLREEIAGAASVRLPFLRKAWPASTSRTSVGGKISHPGEELVGRPRRR